MSFEVDRYTSAWAHIALCADLTWASEPPDDFITANQRLWAQHCRVSHVLQDSGVGSSQTNNHCDLTDKHSKALRDNESCSKRSVKDVIPESRLAQFYGNFYYDNVRENCYTCLNERSNVRYNGHGCENSDLTECWMLPEVEYWFRKLVENSDRTVLRRRRQYKMLADNDFERWNSTAERTAEEDVLEAKIRSVRPLWNQYSATFQNRKSARALSPPLPPRKIRARRRQPKTLAVLAPPPPAYCVDAPAKFFCDPTYKLDIPRHSRLTEYQRVMSRLSTSVQALMRSNASRCPPYRGTNVSRYAPTIPRPPRLPDRRSGIWWSRENQDITNRKYNVNQVQNINNNKAITPKDETTEKKDNAQYKEKDEINTAKETDNQKSESPDLHKKDNVVDDGQLPSTSAAAKDDLKQKRLYSTVLSTSVPSPVHFNTVGCIRLSKNLNPPGFIKLNSKISISSRIRLPIVDNKFEELEKEALEQYKDSDESIDTKFRELEKQAVEQYNTSNSNTSCSSDNSGEKKTLQVPSSSETIEKRLQKTQEDNSVDSVVIYSQNFPDLNAKKQSNSVNLKNFHIPPRGEKNEVTHRLSKCLRNAKNYSKRAASDTDYEAKVATVKGSKGNKGAMRWTLHVMPPKRRHLTLCVSDFSSDEEMKDTCGSIKDAGPCIKKHLMEKIKLSAHGGGDLRPTVRKK